MHNMDLVNYQSLSKKRKNNLKNIKLVIMKNMLKSIWFSLFISILFIGCETEEEITSSGLKINKKNESVVTNSPEVGKVQSAISFLNEHFSKKINSVKGRSNRSLNDYSRNTIDTIYSLNDQNDKPLLKLVAFKQNGYALISNIENVDNPPVLFYSTEKFEKKNVNPGLVNYIEEFINSQPKDRTAANYSLNENEYGSLGHGRETGGTDHGAVVEHLEETKEEKGPLLSTYWNQRAPYNKYCPKHNGTSTLVGCVAIAIGQIMNYHQKNTIKNYNWNKINSNFDSDAASDETAKLLHDIGVGVNMNYGVTGSGSNVKNAVKYFKNAGYKTHSIYSYEGFKKSINNSNPVYLKGWEK